jgi:hypothetical protein
MQSSKRPRACSHAATEQLIDDPSASQVEVWFAVEARRENEGQEGEPSEACREIENRAGETRKGARREVSARGHEHHKAASL